MSITKMFNVFVRTEVRWFKASLVRACLALALVCSGLVGGNLSAAEPTLPKLAGVHRIVVLGDSITQGGDYVVDLECWLLTQHQDIEVINLGLGSETASDLTEAENSGHLKKHGFGRPFISERLNRVLSATKPDMVIACYGMNDGGSLPADETGTRRFAEAVTRLRQAILQAGAKRVVLATPPIKETAEGSWASNVHDQNLARYTAWLLSRRSEGWDVVDIHTPMRQALDKARAKDPAFGFTKDGVHPGREGHWVMASCLLTQYFGANLDGISSAEGLFPQHGPEIRALVRERMSKLFAAYMTQIGHQRPGVPGGPNAKPGSSVAQAAADAATLSSKINQLLTTNQGTLSAQKR